MGLSSFPTSAEGVLPLIIMNSVLSVTLLKNIIRSVVQIVSPQSLEEENTDGIVYQETIRERRISITQFKSLCQNNMSTSKSKNSTTCSSYSSVTNNISSTECCVCLCGFEVDEEVSELSCKHFFHKNCLDKWFGNKTHTTCPLCRSIY